MAKNKNNSASPESALGFSFQDVYSLYLLLKDERSDLELWVESLEDIYTKDKEGNLTLYQLKHTKNNLNNKSDELWNTIGNWCKLINNETIPIENTQFKLVVIVKVLNQQIAYLLCKQHGNYNSIKACEELLKIANEDIKTRKNKPKNSEKQAKNTYPDLFESLKEKQVNESDFELFAQLPYNIRELLVGSSEVIDNTPDVTKLDSIIPSMLHGVYPNKQEYVYNELIGWWQKKIRKQQDEFRKNLSNKSVAPLTKTILRNKIAKINEDYHKDNLPQNYDKQDLEEYRNSIDIKNDNRNFVQQLKKVAKTKKRVERAILNFYLAMNKRMEWTTKDLLFDNEIEIYEERLIEYWEMITGELIDSEAFAINDAEDKEKKEFGLKVYIETEKRKIPPIREKVIQEYIKMGSYHNLVEENKVCWYPEGIMLEQFEEI